LSNSGAALVWLLHRKTQNTMMQVVDEMKKMFLI